VVKRSVSEVRARAEERRKRRRRKGSKTKEGMNFIKRMIGRQNDKLQDGLITRG